MPKKTPDPFGMPIAAMDQTNSNFALVLLFALVVLACARVWIGVGARLMRREALVPYTPRRPAPWTVVDVVLIVVGYILLSIAFAALINALLQPEIVVADALPAFKAMDQLAASVSTGIVTVTCAIALLMFARRATRNDLGMEKGKLFSDLHLGAVGFAAVSVPLYSLQFVLTKLIVPSRHPIVDILGPDCPPLVMLWVGIGVVVIAPVTEEFLFRVVIQGWLEAAETRHVARYRTPEPGFAPTAVEGEPLPVESGNPYQSPTTALAAETALEGDFSTKPGRGFGRLPAGIVPVAATSSLFALLHAGYGPDPIPIFLLSLVLGYLYQRTHRVLPGIVLHMCLNGVSMLMFWLGGGT